VVPIHQHASTFTSRPRGIPTVVTVVGSAGFIGMSLFFVGSPIAVATPSADAVNAIHDRYSAFGGAGSLLGTPVGEPVDVDEGARQDYTGGAIFYSEESGAHVMYGAILDRYRALAGPDDISLGFPMNDESDAGDGVGRFNDFSHPGGASIYWNPATGAWVISGKVLEAWRSSGAAKGPFGYPVADLAETNGVSSVKFAGPQGTEIRWSDQIGLATVPPALAASIPSLSVNAPSAPVGGVTTEGGTMPVATPETTLSAPSVDVSRPKGFNWWPVVIGLGIAALLAGLLAMLSRRRRVGVLPTVRPHEEVLPPKRLVEPLRPEVKAPVPPPPPRPVVPDVATPKAPETPRPPVREVKVVPPPPPPAPAPLVGVVREQAEEKAPLQVNYVDTDPAAGNIEITYENNAVGDNERSRDDKSDLI
jgi:LGFP repeat